MAGCRKSAEAGGRHHPVTGGRARRTRASERAKKATPGKQAAPQRPPRPAPLPLAPSLPPAPRPRAAGDGPTACFTRTCHPSHPPRAPPSPLRSAPGGASTSGRAGVGGPCGRARGTPPPRRARLVASAASPPAGGKAGGGSSGSRRRRVSCVRVCGGGAVPLSRKKKKGGCGCDALALGTPPLRPHHPPRPPTAFQSHSHPTGAPAWSPCPPRPLRAACWKRLIIR